VAKQKGSPKTGGRTPGTPNKKTIALKSITEALGLDVPKRIAELLPQLDPAKQVDVLLNLMSYIYPKRKAVEHSGLEGQPIIIQQTRISLRKLIADPQTFAALEMVEQKLKVVGDVE
jgi:hypothetical protein